jgi:hypothetical protein
MMMWKTPWCAGVAANRYTALTMSDPAANEFCLQCLEFPLTHVFTHEPYYGLRGPTPLFRGCFDYHSAVHGVWSLLRGHRLFPGLRGRIEAVLGSLLTEENLRRELGFLRANRAFELPYGRAWLVRLLLEWREAELARPAIADEFEGEMVGDLMAYFAALARPVVRGAHGNTAFAMWHVADGVDASRKAQLRELLAGRFFTTLPLASFADEQREVDFLAPTIQILHTASRLFSPAELAELYPAIPEWVYDDPVDATFARKKAHHFGVDAARAWALKALCSHLDPERCAAARQRALQKLQAHLPGWRNDYYVTHWVPQFAVMALTS